MAWQNLGADILELFAELEPDKVLVEAQFGAVRMAARNERARYRRWKAGARNQPKMPKHCEECGKLFAPRLAGKLQKFCSVPCRRRMHDKLISDERYERKLSMVARWKAAHRERTRAHARAGYRRRMLETPHIEQRRNERRKAKAHTRRIAEVGTPTCKLCQVPLRWSPTQKGHVPKWCSDACRSRWKRQVSLAVARPHGECARRNQVNP